MRILFLGDIFGRPGRKGIAAKVKGLREELALDLIIANGENASQGIGLSIKNAQQLLDYGVDLLTSGNHIWKFSNIYSFLKTCDRIVRPANLPEGTRGRGWTSLKSVVKCPLRLLICRDGSLWIRWNAHLSAQTKF